MNSSTKINKILDEKLTQIFHSQEKRSYLGASCLGDECSRRIQYGFLKEKCEISASTIRTFDIGHYLEDLVAKWLAKVGFCLSTKNEEGKQYNFSTANGMIRGNTDGIITAVTDDLAEVLNTKENPLPWLWENKTMNDKNWGQTAKHGLFATKMQYYVQVQLYMAYLGLDSCLFSSLNKDSSEIYFEIIKFDSETAQKYSDRAVEILKSLKNQEMFPRIAQSSSFFTCKMCGFREICWKDKR